MKALAALLVACALSSSVEAQEFTLIHAFAPYESNFGKNADGSFVLSELLEGHDGRLYGNANQGGETNEGTVFALATDGSGFTVLKHFVQGPQPNSEMVQGSHSQLIQGPDHTLYGSTFTGGDVNGGTLFSIKPDGSGYVRLHSFGEGGDGFNPNVPLAFGNDGKLYGGSDHGNLFKLDSDGSNYLSLTNISNPRHFILGSDGNFYGCSFDIQGNGAVFQFNTTSNVISYIKVLTNAVVEGIWPAGGVIQGFDGKLYGVAQAGGANYNGTLFCLNTDGSGFKVLHTFSDAHSSSLTNVLGDVGARTNFDGVLPKGRLFQAKDKRLYGTAAKGGPNGSGTVFSIKTDGSDFRVIHAFSTADYDATNHSNADGGQPVAGLIQASDGRLYGTASVGGPNGTGVLFAIDVQPKLKMSRSANELQLIWTSFPDAILESSTSLDSSAEWTTVNSSNSTAVVPLLAAATFYRLRVP